MQDKSIAIVGGAFSGVASTIALSHLIIQSPDARITVYEPGGIGRGIAYQDDSDTKVLNVPASRMSLNPDDPMDFVDWLVEHGVAASASTFALRKLYGQYLHDKFQGVVKRLGSDRISVVQDSVQEISPENDTLSVKPFNTPKENFSHCILAIGNMISQPRAEHAESAWQKQWQHPLPNSVLLIGSGLTAVDQIVELLHMGFEGQITVLSRKGLKPLSHSSKPIPPIELKEVPSSLRELVRFVRRKCTEQNNSGSDWRAVIDGMRAISSDLWKSFSYEEQKSFLRHIKPYWDRVRHRTAPHIGEIIKEAEVRGQIRFIAGTISDITHNEENNIYRVLYNDKKTKLPEALLVEAVVDCAGMPQSVFRSSHPLLHKLLSDGIARPDAHELGIDTTDDGNIIPRDGDPWKDFYAVGSLRVGTQFESTAARELSQQAAAVASKITNE